MRLGEIKNTKNKDVLFSLLDKPCICPAGGNEFSSWPEYVGVCGEPCTAYTCVDRDTLDAKCLSFPNIGFGFPTIEECEQDCGLTSSSSSSNEPIPTPTRTPIPTQTSTPAPTQTTPAPTPTTPAPTPTRPTPTSTTPAPTSTTPTPTSTTPAPTSTTKHSSVSTPKVGLHFSRIYSAVASRLRSTNGKLPSPNPPTVRCLDSPSALLFCAWCP